MIKFEKNEIGKIPKKQATPPPKKRKKSTQIKSKQVGQFLRQPQRSHNATLPTSFPVRSLKRDYR